MAVQSKNYQEWQANLELSIYQLGWSLGESTFTIVPQFLIYGVVFLKLEGEPLFEWMYETIRSAPSFQENCPEKRRIKSIIRLHIAVNNETGYYNSDRKKRKVKQPYPFGEKMLSASSTANKR